MSDECCCTCDDPIKGDVVWAEGDLAFCEDCADKELVECAYCSDLRFPEHLFIYEGHYKGYYGQKMCIGCIDEINDLEYDDEHNGE